MTRGAGMGLRCYKTGMRQTLFASLRAEDGRSLARALIVVMLVSLFAGGLNAGASAATRDAVLCVVDTDGTRGGASGPHVATDCCILGFSAFAMAMAALPPEAAPVDAPVVIGARLAGIAMPAGLFDGRPRARDPPLSA